MRPDGSAAADEDLRTGPFDPLADLLFGLVAILIPIFALLLPAMYMVSDAASSPAETTDARLMQQDVRIRGAPARRFLARAAGLQIAATDGALLIPLDRMLDAPALADALRNAREADAPVLLMIEPDGFEAAFLFEQTAARSQLTKIYQLRLDADCAFVRAASLMAGCTLSQKGSRP